MTDQNTLAEHLKSAQEERDRLRAENARLRAMLGIQDSISKEPSPDSIPIVDASDRRIAVPTTPEKKISLFRSLFRGREDVYAIRWEGKGGKSGYTPAGVMDGRAIQNLFIIYPSAARKDRFIGTTLRYFDPKSGTWRVIFIDPENDSVARFSGGAVGDDRIVLHSEDTDGKETRWSFNDICSDSFVFRDEVSRDGGKTWWVREEDHMKRRGAARVDRALAYRWLLADGGRLDIALMRS